MRRRDFSGKLGHGATLALLVLIGLLWARLFFLQPRGEGLVAPADPGQARIAERKLTELSSATTRLNAAAQHGETQSTTVQFTAAEINAILAAQPDVQDALAEAHVSSPAVRLRSGHVLTTASVEKDTVTLPVTASGVLAAQDGMLLYASDSVRIAHVSASSAVRAAVDARIQAGFDRLQQQLHARVDRVAVGRNRLTLTLSSRDPRPADPPHAG